MQKEKKGFFFSFEVWQFIPILSLDWRPVSISRGAEKEKRKVQEKEEGN